MQGGKYAYSSHYVRIRAGCIFLLNLTCSGKESQKPAHRKWGQKKARGEGKSLKFSLSRPLLLFFYRPSLRAPVSRFFSAARRISRSFLAIIPFASSEQAKRLAKLAVVIYTILMPILNKIK